MKHFVKKSLFAGALLCATALSGTAMAQSTTETVQVGISVQNTVNAALDATNNSINFGVIALRGGSDGLLAADGTSAGNTDGDMNATATVLTDGTVTAEGQAIDPLDLDVAAIGFVVDDSSAQQAIINITNGVDGADLNFTLDTFSDPANGAFETLSFESVITQFNADAADAPAATSGAPIQFTDAYVAAYNGGTNTLSIGGTIDVPEDTTSVTEGLYSGSLTVTVSY